MTGVWSSWGFLDVEIQLLTHSPPPSPIRSFAPPPPPLLPPDLTIQPPPFSPPAIKPCTKHHYHRQHWRLIWIQSNPLKSDEHMLWVGGKCQMNGLGVGWGWGICSPVSLCRVCVCVCVCVCGCVGVYVCGCFGFGLCFSTTALSRARKFKSPYSSRKSSATHSYEWVHSFTASVLEKNFVLTSAQMSMYATAHAGCPNTAIESALTTDWEKYPLHIGDSNPRQYYACHSFSVRRSTHWTTSAPLRLVTNLTEVESGFILHDPPEVGWSRGLGKLSIKRYAVGWTYWSWCPRSLVPFSWIGELFQVSSWTKSSYKN